MPKNRLFDEDTLVIGLGRFGAAAAMEMQQLGYRVTAVERDADRAERYNGKLAKVVPLDAGDPESLQQLRMQSFRVAVVAVGSSIESSLLAAGNLVDAEVSSIWAKAVSAEHGRILTRIGVHHVVFPEGDSGRRVAHLVNERLKDYIEFDDGYAIAKMTPPSEMVGFTLGQSQIRSKYGVTVVGVKAPGEGFTYAVPDTKVGAHHTLIVSGPRELIGRLAARP
ncbi:MAG TPA: TrkA family potassium uptake protein [Segeticoccus sp.]|jgi:trk system potassium uptake protein TrkA|nr:TrkA family potassium uptake protein [Segeticoccus sp.]